MSATPLSGVRVIELCAYVSGPMAGAMLADQGADVIKVEAPGGDNFREVGTARAGWAAMFMALNRNKRSIALDLKQADDREALLEIIAQSDVVLQNARPGVMERLGLGSKELCARFPRLIYASIRGYGVDGPNAQEGALDPMVQALSGLAHMQRDHASGQPDLVRTWVADKLVAPMIGQAVSAALYQRERTGKGCAIDHVMLDALIWWLWPEGMMNHAFIGDDVHRDADIGASTLVSKTTDGYIVASPHSEKGWETFVEFSGRTELRDDPRFITRAARMSNLGAFVDVVRSSLGTHGSAEWCERFREADVPAAPILSPEQVFAHPQVVWNDIIQEVEHPVAGRYRSPRPPTRFDGRNDAPIRPAPALGEHTAEVLQELGVKAVPTALKAREAGEK